MTTASRFVSVLLMLSIAISTTVHAGLRPPCEVPLISGAELEKHLLETFSRYTEGKKVKFWRKVALMMRKRGIKNKTLERCALTNGCTLEDLSKILDEEIASHASSTKANVMGTVFLTIAGGLAISEPYIKSALPENIKGIGLIINIGIAGAIYGLVKTMRTKLDATIERATKKQLSEEEGDAADPTQRDNDRRLRLHQDKVDAHHTGGAFKATTRISEYIGNLLMPTIVQLNHFLEQPNSKKRNDQMIDWLTTLAMNSRVLYNEDPSAQESVAATMYLLFVKNLEPVSRERWKENILVSLEKHDTEYKITEKYYMTMIDNWFSEPKGD